jgi:hypothetical protein
MRVDPMAFLRAGAHDLFAVGRYARRPSRDDFVSVGCVKRPTEQRDGI